MDPLYHLDPKAQAVMRRPDEERILFARTERWVRYEMAENIHRMMKDLVDAPPKPRMEGLLIVGPTGVGKTTILRRFRDKVCPPFQDSDGISRTPVHITDEHTSTNIGEFWARILTSLGEDPGRGARKTFGQEQRALACLADSSCRMLIIDEFHNIFPALARQQREWLVVVKTLSNRLNIPLVIAGTEEAAHALRSDAQLAGRFRMVVLPAWKEDAEFRGFLGALERRLPLRKPSGMKSTREIGSRLYQMSGGTLGKLTSIIQEATIAAIRSGDEQITPALLDRIAAERKSPFDNLN